MRRPLTEEQMLERFKKTQARMHNYYLVHKEKNEDKNHLVASLFHFDRIWERFTWDWDYAYGYKKSAPRPGRSKKSAEWHKNSIIIE